MQKARQKQISYAEAEELRKFLEEQKREYEASGDIGGAILAGLLTLFILGVIATLVSGRRAAPPRTSIVSFEVLTPRSLKAL